MTGPVRRPAVLAHGFLTAKAAADPASPAGQALARTWQRIRDSGMTAPVHGWPTELSTDSPGYAEREVVLAAVCQVLPDGLREAYVYRAHDVIGISVVQSEGDARTDWSGLDTPWFDGWPHGGSGVLGTATVYLGLLPGLGPASMPSADAAALAAQFAAAVPGGDGWASHWWRPTRELMLWELPPGDDAPVPTDRRLAAVAAVDDEPATDEFFWGATAAGLPPLTRYLLQVAKVRYESGVLQSRLARLHLLMAQAAERCDELASLVHRDELDLAGLREADGKLRELRVGRDGLVAALGDVRAMAGTVRIAQANMRAALEPGGRGSAAGPLENDRQTVRWANHQLQVEQSYLSASLAQVTELGQAFGRNLEERFRVVDEKVRERQENLVWLQTVVIGALLMMLAGIQSVEYKVPLPGALLAPSVCLLAAIALLLPWALRRVRVRERRWVAVDVAFVVLFGATGGWLATSLVAQAVRGHGAPWQWSLAAAAFGSIVAVAVQRWWPGSAQPEPTR
ncbi:hypothetical protein Cs7R123_12550 [Catellatospora sp. TT07R-123]|uniref:CATRA conflict system CASPASE/TPR repeat-associated protein n=1 Tax=Catellatospora sp. TT07R-123 TaxID=2733863 RepID=UPI001B192DF7|nr:CATRA conflict system CASPASE/TPR repeat-associated protein [Catellatospora sp. TT07R-123]GHJ43913.1 hypothetical protein Cs7R123_12550 [Catellatospora sp. TT07R-123]